MATPSNLDHYEVQFFLGSNYPAEDESTVSRIDPRDPRELLTDMGLTTPGATASFKVYVITSTGNEGDSNAMTVSRSGKD